MENKKIALLIDGDNISADYISCIVNEIIENDWIITYRRIYGDWTSPQASKWKDKLQEFSITPIQQFCNVAHKNSTDSALIIDAMDILYTGNVDGFCLVSSDSDFTRLASRLKESGMNVIGMGEKKAPHSFRNACSVFTDVEILFNQEIPEKLGDTEDLEDENTIELTKENVIKEIENIIINNNGSGKTTGLGEIGSRLINKYPEFDVRKYGYSILSKFIEDMSEFTFHKENNKQHVTLTNEGKPKEEVTSYIVQLVKSSGKKYMELGDLGQKIHNKYQTFNVKDFGYSKLSTFIQNIPQLEITSKGNLKNIVCMKNK